MKNYQETKLKPQKACYYCDERDLWGIEFDARFKGEEQYRRMFYVPAADFLYIWRSDLKPEQFVRIPVKSISEKRKVSLLEAWQASKDPKLAPEPAPVGG